MKTTFDQISILFHRASNSPLKDLISGGIYKTMRPSDSEVEDLVINSLPITSDQIQRGTANVNIYVPDLVIRLGNKKQHMANTERLGSLAQVAISTFSEFHAETYSFWLVNQTTIQEAEINQHYINLRIDFRFFPTL